MRILRGVHKYTVHFPDDHAKPASAKPFLPQQWVHQARVICRACSTRTDSTFSKPNIGYMMLARQPAEARLAFCVLGQRSLLLLWALYCPRRHSCVVDNCLAARSAVEARPVHRRGLHTWMLPLLCQAHASLLLHSKHHVLFSVSFQTPVCCCNARQQQN
jgi:hypothetical protein